MFALGILEDGKVLYGVAYILYILQYDFYNSYFDLLVFQLFHYWSHDQQHAFHFFQASLHKDSMPHNKEGTLHKGKLLHLLVGLHKSKTSRDQHLYEVQGSESDFIYYVYNC